MADSLGKPIGREGVYAESWEISDHGADQSIVEFGPLAGISLQELVCARGEELLGRHHPQQSFPLLVKFLDASQLLSVQVHPDDAIAARLNPPDLGKTEAWVVMESEPNGVIYAGLKPGVDRNGLADAIRRGNCQDCLHHFHPAPGDCVFLQAGTVHTVGQGVLVAEIQQSSDATFRLFDWNRVGADGRPRPLHIEQSLEAIDFGRGPVLPQEARPTERPEVVRLAECRQFVLDRCSFSQPFQLGGDRRCHVVMVLHGAIEMEGDPAQTVLPRGGTSLLPACVGPIRLTPQGQATILDAYLP